MSVFVVCALYFVHIVIARTPIYEHTHIYNDILTESQFNDIVMRDDLPMIISKHTFLLLYKEECADLIEEFGIHQSALPPPQDCVLLKYEYNETQKYTWCHEENYFTKRFPPTECITVYSLPMGLAHKDKPIAWDTIKYPDFQDWAWNQIRTTVDVTNKLDKSIEILFKSKGPNPTSSTIVGAGEFVVFDAYPSDYMFVLDSNGEFIDGKVIHGPLLYSLDEDDLVKLTTTTKEDWEEKAWNEEFQKIEAYRNKVVGKAKDIVRMIKQYFITPNVTATGYQKLSTPKRVHSLLVDHYESQNVQKNKQTGSDGSLVVNIGINKNTKEKLEKLMLPMAEQWCGCKLKLTSSPGINIYNAGYKRELHLTSVENEIISVMFQMNGNTNWPFELCTYNGSRTQLSLEAGDMVMYESAKVVHGRPMPLGDTSSVDFILRYALIEPQWTLKTCDVEEGINIDSVEDFRPLGILRSLTTKTKLEIVTTESTDHSEL